MEETEAVRGNWRDWLNPAVVRGVVLIGAALLLLVNPDLSNSLFQYVIGGALVLLGIVNLWHTAQWWRRNRAWQGLGESVLALGLGGLIIYYPTATLDVIALILGIYLGVRGLGAIYRAIRGGPGHRVVELIRGGAMLSVATIAIFLPASLLASTVILASIVAMAVGALFVTYGVQAAIKGEAGDADADNVTRIVGSWVNSWDIGHQRREAIGDTLYFEEPEKHGKLVAWWVMLTLSVVIATFAVLQDSTAVVIGAMLVAPLMVPILGAAAAIVNGRQERVVRSLLLVAGGVTVAIALAYIISTWAPSVVPLDTNSQITSRVNPNILDMGIALAAGAAGAFATVNTRVANSIAGVAIAVALVPPLAVVGVLLQATRYEDAFGAFLLFITNLVAILLSAVATFILNGFTSAKRLRANREKIVSTMGVVVGVALIILLPLVMSAQGVIASAVRTSTAQRVATDWIGDNKNLELRGVRVTSDDVTVEVAGSSRLPSVKQLGDQMTKELGTPTEVVVVFTPALVTTYQDNGTVIQDESPLIPDESGRVTAPQDDPTPSGTPSASASPTSSPTASPTSGADGIGERSTPTPLASRTPSG